MMEKELDKTNWRTEKIISLEEGSRLAEEWRRRGQRIVTVNGSFDILHVGHLDQLEEAKKQGDVLVVGVNSDQSVQGYKGEERPYWPASARAAMLAALVCVDYVIVIDKEAKKVQDVLLRAIKPHVHANGEEYGEPQKWIEWPVMHKMGAEGYVIKKRNDFSTSALVDKIRKLK